jgi:phosphoglycerate kinase
MYLYIHEATIPTLTELLRHNPKSIVLLSHLGRPNGQRNPKHSLKPVVQPLEQLLGRPVTFLDDCVGDNVVNQVNSSQGQVFLCENVRFHP